MEDTRLESFPFDSKQAGTDDYGYPVYDRAVGASMLRQTFAKFFSNGVFDVPSNAFEISKGSGLKINIAEGISIINGAMASVPEGGISVSLTDETITAGTYAYGVFLRYDENSDKRSCYITVRKGNAGTSPTPPEPERSAPGIWELRLGYVVVPTGSSDLSSATVTNEKGLEYCPFAFPFEEIDLSSVTSDAKSSANEALTYLLDYFDKYKDMVDAAVDQTLAGQLQTQINELQDQLNNFDLSGSVDGKTILYGIKPGDAKETLYVNGEEIPEVIPDKGISGNKLEDGAVDNRVLSENAAYENLQNASSSDYGKTKLSDTDDISQSSENAVAATPKGVYSIVKRNVGAKVSCPEYAATSGVYYPFETEAQATGNAFEIQSEKIVAKEKMLVFVWLKTSSGSSYSSSVSLRINEEEFYKNEGANVNAEYTCIVSLDEGDYITVYISGSPTQRKVSLEFVVVI